MLIKTLRSYLGLGLTKVITPNFLKQRKKISKYVAQKNKISKSGAQKDKI